MEHLVAPTPGRPNPRWSRLFTGGAAQTVSSPALIAGLNASSAMVCVGPPLLASPAGSSSGFVLQNDVPVVLAQLVPLKPQVVASSMLCPPSVKIAVIPAGTPQFPPEVLLASMLFVTVRVPSLLMAPPRVALLPEKVLLVTVREPGLGMAPRGRAEA